MNPMPEITPLLKRLRLSGISETLAVRNREAIANQLSFSEFLATVLQDEIARRENSKFAKRLRQSHINSNKTLEQFDFSFNPRINQEMVCDLATCRFIDENAPALLVGPCGTGKSHIAQAIGHCAIRQGRSTLFFTQSKLLQVLNNARAMGQYDKQLQMMINVPLLIIDDFGLKPLRQGQDEDLHDLITERYEARSTLVTSNLAFSEWGDAFPNKLLGAAILDRLAHSAYKVVLEGNSYRSQGVASESTINQKKELANPDNLADY